MFLRAHVCDVCMLYVWNSMPQVVLVYDVGAAYALCYCVPLLAVNVLLMAHYVCACCCSSVPIFSWGALYYSLCRGSVTPFRMKCELWIMLLLCVQQPNSSQCCLQLCVSSFGVAVWSSVEGLLRSVKCRTNGSECAACGLLFPGVAGVVSGMALSEPVK